MPPHHQYFYNPMAQFVVDEYDDDGDDECSAQLKAKAGATSVLVSPADQLWSFWLAASHRKSVISMYSGSLLLIFIAACLIFAAATSTLFKKSEISQSAADQEHQEIIRRVPNVVDYSPSNYTVQKTIPPPLISSNATSLIDFSVGGCNIFRGEWIPHPEGPAYTSASCQFIQDHQNCMRNGRPDRGFLYWQWKPYHCKLPLFDAKAFLKIVAGKMWVFVGDSLARNNYHSVLCLLSQVEMPVCTYNDGSDWSVEWYFKSYNFTLAVRWAPFLVKYTEEEVQGFARGIEKVYVDEVSEMWAPALHTFDYIVFSAAHWYTRPSLYFNSHNKLLGSHYLPSLPNITDVGYNYGFRAALHAVFDFLVSSEYKGVVLFRTVAPGHWDQEGSCPHKAPLQSSSTLPKQLDQLPQDLYTIQLEEFAKMAHRISSGQLSFNLKIVDVTESALLRPDAHPGPYSYINRPGQQDCLHWCLPGAVDTWSAMLLDVLRHL